MTPLLLFGLLRYLATLGFVACVSVVSAHASCKKPAIRKEWRELGRHGQKQYIDAMNCLSALPHSNTLRPTGATPDAPPLNPNSSRYDDIVYTHIDAVATAHYTGLFIPWHRLFLHTFENILHKECHYPGHVPYWDWTLDSTDIKNSPVFDPDPVIGLGSFPDASTNYTVVTGALPHLIRAYPQPHQIQRNFTLRPWLGLTFLGRHFAYPEPRKEANITLTVFEWNKIITGFKGNFSAFQTEIDGYRLQGLHGSAHIIAGGDLSNVSHSPNDIVFWLLHAQIDRLWAHWQAYDPANRYAIGGGETQDILHVENHLTGTGPPVTKDTIIPMAGLGPDVEVKDVFDIKGHLLCYEYSK